MSAAVSLLTPAGEVIEAVDARTVLRAAGIDDIETAETVNLAAFDGRARELESIVKEARGLANARLVADLDAEARWTVRVGAYLIKAPSPKAGTVAYDPGALYAALLGLVVGGHMTQAAMDGAVRDARPVAQVPWELLRDVVEAIWYWNGLDHPDYIRITGALQRILDGEPTEPRWTVVLGGVDRLLKLGGPVAEVIEGCRVEVEPPRRVAKVTRERP